METIEEKLNKLIEMDDGPSCTTLYTNNYGPGSVCGTNNKDYPYLVNLQCEQQMEYGKQINLQLKHEGTCWIWERYGYETDTVLFVSILRIDSILRENRLIFCLIFVADFIHFFYSHWCVPVYMAS